MQPFSWSKAELLESKNSDHDKTQRRYSLNNEDFEYHSLLELFWALDDQGLLREGAIYYAADFGLVEPDCFENVDEVLQLLETRHLENFDPMQVYFTSADEVARMALKRAIGSWINEQIYVEHHWCLMGKSQQITVTPSDIPAIDTQPTAALLGKPHIAVTGAAEVNPAGVRRLKALRQKMTWKSNRLKRHS